MKFIASTSELQKQLQTINGVISSRAVIPILEYFLFEIEDSKLRVTGTDLEVSMRSSIEVEAKEDGKVAVPAKFILDILKGLSDQPVTFTIDDDSNAIQLTSDNGKYKITGESPEDFPKFPEVEGGNSLELSSYIMHEAIGKTLFAIGNDELRPALTGLFFELGEDDTRFVATDGNKLVKYLRTDHKSEKNDSFILPKKTLNLLRNSLPDGGAEVKLSYNDTNALFNFNDIELICRLIDERFPDYNAAIPTETPNKLTINRNDLMNSLKRISVFSNKTTYQVRFKIAGSQLQLSSQDIDYSNEGYEELPCEYDGEDMEIGFSARFLIEMLQNLDSDKVTISLSAHNRPGIVKPEEMEEGEDVLMLLMPIVLNFQEDE